MMRLRVVGTGLALPSDRRTTHELARLAVPHRDAAEIEAITGIRGRHWLGSEDAASTLASLALRQALAAARLEPPALRRLIFASSTGGDWLIPATANCILDDLGLDDHCDAFDLNNSCAGFLSAFDVAARSIATGLGPVAVVVSETFSRYIAPASPRPYLVLGDAAAAVVLQPSGAGGVLASAMKNSGELRGLLSAPHPGRTGKREPLQFKPSHEEMTASALRLVRARTTEALQAASLGLRDIDWFLPHQPNGSMFERFAEEMGFGLERCARVVHELGSVGAASIPASLHRLLESGVVSNGDRILLVGVGGGTASGAIIYQHGAAGE